LIGAHFHSNGLQNLFKSHVSIPVSHGGQLFTLESAGLRIDAVHIDFRDETNRRSGSRILLWAVNAQLIEPTIVLCLEKVEQ
jgi:hypothetical protein